MSHNKETLDVQMFLWIAVVVIILFIIPIVYKANANAINSALLDFSQLQLRPFSVFSVEAQNALERITSVEPATLSWENMEKVLKYVGTWWRWPYVLLLALLGTVSLFMGRTSGLTRRLNMESLLKHNADSFACLHPIVGKGKYLLSPTSHDSGHWRIALSPVQFAVEHGLLVDEQGTTFTVQNALRNGLAYADLPAYGNALLDEQETATVLAEQLGKPFTGYADLSPWRQALASAFLAYASGDKTTCMDILDTLSASYTEQDDTPQCPITKDGTFQEQIFTVWEKHKGLLDNVLMVRHTSFILPWFMALLTLARKKGVLASSQFLWLRPLDRPLWYALNQCGGRAAWAEAFASWAHYSAEEKAGHAVLEASTAHAVQRLKDTLATQGWLATCAFEVESSGSHFDDDDVIVFADSDSTSDEDDYATDTDAALQN